MIDHLMCDPAVILQDVVVLSANGFCERFGYGLGWWISVRNRRPLPLLLLLLFRRWYGRVVRRGGEGTMSSLKLSSGMSVSFAPWNLGTTSCICGFGQFLFPFSVRCILLGLLLGLIGLLEVKFGDGWGTGAYSVALAQRLDIQEGKDFVGFEEFERGDIAWWGGVSLGVGWM